MSCQRCGFENPAGFRFCGSCGAPLTSPVQTGREEERKIVSALFCDVAGSTERAERLDPEDVRESLTQYYIRVRAELERFGGTVEKFIGDAVFGLFGAPRSHGDDPERAVRAALAMRDAVADLRETDPDLDLHVRIGVTTGEAVVAVSAQPSVGEAMAWGDVVNIASRLQVAAPIDAILVDESTYRATRHVVEYGEAEPVEAKGKSEPILVWRAVATRSRRGVDLSQAGREPLVGRREELSLLLKTLNRVGRQRTPELVTLVGEPGVGKSRLVFELFRRIELSPALITWRQARSSPYDDGFSFWALSEIVKSQAGILETDGAGVASEKLGRAVRDLVSVPADAARIESHLRSLIGVGPAAPTYSNERQATFAAWRDFLEAVARRHTLVAVFEDIQWADDALLDFIEFVLESARSVRILIICTARPELAELRASWGQSENTTRLLVLPLSDDETRDLVAELAPDAIPTDTKEAIVGAASGNPLYAVEYVRMLEDRSLSEPDVGAERRELMSMPEKIRAIIAERLDVLSGEDKALLQDAAVVGRVVWPGALAAIGGRSRRLVDRHLRALERREFLMRSRTSSVEHEPEYRFRHGLMREVANDQIPRSRRRETHLRAAEWLESLSPDRTDDRVELLAHHYLSAHELARAARAKTADLTERARFSLRDAGDRALALHSFSTAARYLNVALELWPEEDPERPWLLLRLGKSLYFADMEGADVLSEAGRLLEIRDRESAAEAVMLLADLANQRGEPQEIVFEHAYRALALLEGREASHAKADVLVDLAVFLALAAEHTEAIGYAREALSDAEALGLRELQARALATIGISRGLSGDPDGRADLERGIAISEEIDSPFSSHHCGMLADLELNLGNLDKCFELQARAREHAQRFGNASHIQWFRAELVAECYWTGRWDEALSIASEFVAETESGSRHFMEGYCRGIRGRIRLARDDLVGALEDSVKALDHARASKQPQMLCPALAFRARSLTASESLDQAAEVADELLALWRSKLDLVPASSWVVDLVCALESLGLADELRDAADGIALRTPWIEAAIAFACSEFQDAADGFARIGSRPDEALAHLRAAQSLERAGRDADARPELERALAFYRGVEARANLREAESVLVA